MAKSELSFPVPLLDTSRVGRIRWVHAWICLDYMRQKCERTGTRFLSPQGFGPRRHYSLPRARIRIKTVWNIGVVCESIPIWTQASQTHDPSGAGSFKIFPSRPENGTDGLSFFALEGKIEQRVRISARKRPLSPGALSIWSKIPKIPVRG